VGVTSFHLHCWTEGSDVIGLGTHKVHTDKDGVIYDVSLNQSNAGNNNNKFYRIQLLEKLTGGEYHTWTRWGRVGERGMNATLGSGSFQEALAVFEKKFKDKTGHKWEKRLDPPKPNKYVFIERSYEPDTSEDDSKAKSDAGARRSSVQSLASDKSIGLPPSTLPLPVQNLMELIFNQQYMKDVLATLEYDVDKLPLGKLSKRTLEQGYQALKVRNEVSSFVP
jgi:poly [ADP-ribose] polymerase